MALQTHRFVRGGVDIGSLAKRLPSGSGLALGTNPPSPQYEDVRVDDANPNNLLELVEEMGRLGYSYHSLNPVTTPTAQAATALGVGGTGSYKYIDEPFVTGNVDTDEIGLHNWRTNTNGTGADISIVPGELGRPGIIRLGAGTAAAAKADVHIGDSLIGGHFLLNAPQNQWDTYWDVRPGGSFDPTDLEVMQFGFGLEWTLTGQLLNGVLVRYLAGIDTFWTLLCVNAGATSVSAGTTAPALDTWVRLGVRITYPGGVPTAQLMVNGVAEGTPITTNFPTTAQGVGAKIDGVGSADPEAFVHVDHCEVSQAA